MKYNKLIELIPKLEKIKDPDDLEIIETAINSCLTVQALKKIKHERR